MNQKATKLILQINSSSLDFYLKHAAEVNVSEGVALTIFFHLVKRSPAEGRGASPPVTSGSFVRSFKVVRHGHFSFPCTWSLEVQDSNISHVAELKRH